MVATLQAYATADNTVNSIYAFALATYLMTGTLVCLVEMWGDADWPREIINKNIPGYLIFFAAGMFRPAAHLPILAK